MTNRINANPEVIRRNLSNLRRLDAPTLQFLLEEKDFQGKTVAPDPEFAKLVHYMLRKKQRGRGELK